MQQALMRDRWQKGESLQQMVPFIKHRVTLHSCGAAQLKSKHGLRANK